MHIPKMTVFESEFVVSEFGVPELLIYETERLAETALGNRAGEGEHGEPARRPVTPCYLVDIRSSGSGSPRPEAFFGLPLSLWRRRMRAFLGVTIIALTGAVSAPGLAQQSLHSQIEGTWKITAFYDQFTDGHKRNTFGDNPQGVAEFTSNGTFIFQLMSGGQIGQARNQTC